MATASAAASSGPADPEIVTLLRMTQLLEGLEDPEAVARVVFWLASKAGFTLTATANVPGPEEGA